MKVKAFRKIGSLPIKEINYNKIQSQPLSQATHLQSQPLNQSKSSLSL